MISYVPFNTGITNHNFIFSNELNNFNVQSSESYCSVPCSAAWIMASLAYM